MRKLISTSIASLLFISGQALAQPSPSPRLLLVCAPCHGFDGIGRTGTIPNLAGQRRDYLQNQMSAFRSKQRQHPEMSFFSGQVNWDEINELLDFYAALPAQ